MIKNGLANYNLLQKSYGLISIVSQRKYSFNDAGKINVTSVDPIDVENFAKYAKDWWNVNGLFKPLHVLNSIRVPFIRDGLISTGKVNADNKFTSHSLKGLNLLEVGCGGGILTEQLSRLHANVTAIDPGTDVIKIARDHVTKNIELSKRIDYRIDSIENHANSNPNKYDAVIVSEVLEHVKEKASFLEACIVTLKPGGSIFITTFDKTICSWFANVFLAENILNLIPKNTHDWNNFITPIDTQRILDEFNCSTILINGFVYEFWSNTFKWIPSTQFSYALQAIKN